MRRFSFHRATGHNLALWFEASDCYRERIVLVLKDAVEPFKDVVKLAVFPVMFFLRAENLDRMVDLVKRDQFHGVGCEDVKRAVESGLVGKFVIADHVLQAFIVRWQGVQNVFSFPKFPSSEFDPQVDKLLGKQEIILAQRLRQIRFTNGAKGHEKLGLPPQLLFDRVGKGAMVNTLDEVQAFVVGYQWVSCCFFHSSSLNCVHSVDTIGLSANVFGKFIYQSSAPI